MVKAVFLDRDGTINQLVKGRKDPKHVGPWTMKEFKYINGVADAYKRLTEEEMIAQQEAQRTFEFGWNKAFKQYAEDAGNYAKVASDMFSSMTSNMNSALDNFVKTGKLNFKSLVADIIQGLIKIQLQAQMTKIFSSIGGSSLFGSLFGGGYQSGVSSLANAPYPKFAEGGSISGPSIVGERGPELFIPRTAGTIIPNNQLGQAFGNNTNITNNYINAIDTKSFEDRLYGSANAVWAANQYAGNKNLATSRSRA